MTTEQLEKPKVKFTLERFYPDFTMKYGAPLLQRHINRYKWAGSKLKAEDQVLDAGCGCGWFDHILLNTCEKVHGVDVSAEAIHYAKWKASEVGENQLTYEVKDLSKVLPGYLFDQVICIEMIEHMDEPGQHNFMLNMEAMLKIGGQLMITTPIMGKATGKYHKHEFEEGEFEVFLKQYFNKVTFDDPTMFKIPKHFMLATCRGFKL